jgi:predicted NodU family carbamoyl transferase
VKILGINISHEPSVCVYENNKILQFYNEERFVFKKNYDPLNAKLFQSILQKINFKPDMVCYASFGRNSQYYKCNDQEIIKNLQNQLNNPPYYFNIKEHHLYHAVTAFYFSKFNKAAAIVIDGGGACNSYLTYQEVESIYFINKKSIIPFYKHSTCWRSDQFLDIEANTWQRHKYIDGYLNKFSNQTRGGIDFANACIKVGYPGGSHAGKVMGLSSYGYTKKKFNLDYEKVKIAKEVQEKTFEETCVLIDSVKDKYNNIVLSGGYFLNCSNNFKYVKKYPKINFFVDPVPHDAGTAIGAAVYYDNYKR